MPKACHALRPPMPKTEKALRMAYLVLDNHGLLEIKIFSNGPTVEAALNDALNLETPVRLRRIFQNRVRIFHSIDRHELDEAGYPIGGCGLVEVQSQPAAVFHPRRRGKDQRDLVNRQGTGNRQIGFRLFTF